MKSLEMPKLSFNYIVNEDGDVQHVVIPADQFEAFMGMIDLLFSIIQADEEVTEKKPATKKKEAATAPIKKEAGSKKPASKKAKSKK